MDLDNIGQNMNTRVVFREPRGMIRWLQLFFAILALSTVADFSTTIGISITCPQASTTTAATPTNGTITQAPPVVPQTIHVKFLVQYPFDFTKMNPLQNECPGSNYTYVNLSSSTGSSQFFVMTGVMSLLYASGTLALYLFYSSFYDSTPALPVTDLIITGILCLFWFIGSSAFSSGVSLLKNTVTYKYVEQALCPNQFLSQPLATCFQDQTESWKSLNIGLVSGFTSFFLWGTGLWFVYKETHFHTPRY